MSNKKLFLLSMKDNCVKPTVQRLIVIWSEDILIAQKELLFFNCEKMTIMFTKEWKCTRHQVSINRSLASSFENWMNEIYSRNGCAALRTERFDGCWEAITMRRLHEATWGLQKTLSNQDWSWQSELQH